MQIEMGGLLNRANTYAGQFPEPTPWQAAISLLACQALIAIAIELQTLNRDGLKTYAN
jgi:hypothetical protein